MKEEINQKNKKENGQIIVLLALSLVVVMIVAALAVDGGTIYSQRRYVQNAADAASLAGGGAALNYFQQQKIINISSCDDSKIKTAMQLAEDKAIEVAGLNNFPGLIPDQDVVVTCNAAEDYLDTQVKINSQISTAFAHLIFPGSITTTNEAVARTNPPVDMGDGNGIVSLSDKCKNNIDGMEYTGTGDVTVYGGGIHSNSCMTGSGNVIVDASDGGSINLVDEAVTINGGAILQPTPYNTKAAPIPIREVPTPPCATNVQSLSDPKNNDVTISGGSFTGLKMTGGKLTLNEGMYCFNGDVTVTGGVIDGKKGVTIVMNSGDIKINGNATVTLIAPYSNRNYDFYGMLIYMPPTNNGLIALVGNENSLYAGTIYAPSGSVEMGGTSSVDTEASYACKEVLNPETPDPNDTMCAPGTFNTSIIAWYVKVVGTSQMDIIYDSSIGFKIPGYLYLLK